MRLPKSLTLLSLLLAICLLPLCTFTFTGCGEEKAKEELLLYVSPDGDDAAKGTANAPFATFPVTSSPCRQRKSSGQRSTLSA